MASTPQTSCVHMGDRVCAACLNCILALYAVLPLLPCQAAHNQILFADNCTTAFADAPRPIPPPPPPDYSGLISGVTIAGIVALVLIAAPICLMAYSIPTYSFRAYKRELEDGVYALIVGARSDDQLYEAEHASLKSVVTVSMCLRLASVDGDAACKIFRCLNPWM